MTPYWTNGLTELYQADARQIPMPDKSAHCVVTSPPYYGLRVYRADKDAMIGLEETPEQWLASMMQVMDEVWRVLRDDGICWVNLGDSYAGSGKGQNGDGTHNHKTGDKQHTNTGSTLGGLDTRNGTPSGQLLGIPWRFALAMQERGWILRDDVIWAKKSAMPESLAGTRWERCKKKVAPCEVGGDIGGKAMITGDGRKSGLAETWLAQWSDCPGCAKCEANDGYVLRYGSWRCTSSYEHIFMFVKKMGYYSDGEAVKLPSLSDHPSGNGFKRDARMTYQNADGSARGNDEQWQVTSTANRRNVWNDIKPEPFGGEHYATFPSDLPRICIQASTSEAGCCSECGAQWARVVEKGEYQEDPQRVGRSVRNIGDYEQDGYREQGGTLGLVAETRTLSWRPTCTCNADKVPPVVLDPFCGTATTCMAAMRLGRRSVGVDLSQDYLNMAIKRLSGQTLPLLEFAGDVA